MAALFKCSGGKVASEHKSPSEITIAQDGNVLHLCATGPGSRLSLLTAYTEKDNATFRLHFGAMLKQRGKWVMTWKGTKTEGRFLLIDHLGHSIRIQTHRTAFAAKTKLSSVYKNTKMDVWESDGGFSSVACWRFLGAEVLNQQLSMKYSNIYKFYDVPFFADNETNCLRFMSSMFLLLKLDYKLAKEATTKRNYKFWKDNWATDKKIIDTLTVASAFYEDLHSIFEDHPKKDKTIAQLVMTLRDSSGLDVSTLKLAAMMTSLKI